MSGPTVSVVIPAYNVSAFIAEALESVIAQSFTDFEAILINDGSLDTIDLEKAIAPFRERIVYLAQENRGAAAARNTGLRRAAGKYVAFLDADDVWHPEYLKEQLAFAQDGDFDFVYCDAMLTGDSPLSGRTYMETSPSVGPVTAESLLALRCNVITSGVLAKRSLVVDVGMFDEAIRRAHDFDLWLRLTKHGARIKYQKKVLLTHRILETGLTGDSVSQQERALTVLGSVEQRVALTETERAALARTLERVRADLDLAKGKAFLGKRNFPEALAAFRSANEYFRSWKLTLVLIGLRLAPDLVLGFSDRTKKS